MKTNSKYSRFHKQEEEQICTRYIPRDSCPRKHLIKFPVWIDDALIQKVGIGNISRYIKDLIVKDLRIQRPFSDEERDRLNNQMKDELRVE